MLQALQFDRLRNQAPPAQAGLFPKNHLYSTAQPYGLVLAVVTGFPASDSSRATLT